MPRCGYAEAVLLALALLASPAQVFACAVAMSIIDDGLDRGDAVR
jgi:hypothetical protein